MGLVKVKLRPRTGRWGPSRLEAYKNQTNGSQFCLFPPAILLSSPVTVPCRRPTKTTGKTNLNWFASIEGPLFPLQFSVFFFAKFFAIFWNIGKPKVAVIAVIRIGTKIVNFNRSYESEMSRNFPNFISFLSFNWKFGNFLNIGKPKVVGIVVLGLVFTIRNFNRIYESEMCRNFPNLISLFF